jgi:hypothetical protein
VDTPERESEDVHQVHLGVRLDETRVLLVLLPLEGLREASEVVPRRRRHAVVVDDSLLVAEHEPIVDGRLELVGERHLVNLLVLDVPDQPERNDELVLPPPGGDRRSFNSAWERHWVRDPAAIRNQWSHSPRWSAIFGGESRVEQTRD